MKAAGYDVRESNPFERDQSLDWPLDRAASHCVGRIEYRRTKRPFGREDAFDPGARATLDRCGAMQVAVSLENRKKRRVASCRHQFLALIWRAFTRAVADHATRFWLC